MTVNSPSATANDTAASTRPFTATALGVSLTATDLPASIAWYRDVIGFTVDQEYVREGTLRAAALRAGDVRILLNQDDGARGWDRVKGEGFSLSFTTPDSIDDIANRIRARGGKLDTEPADMPWGVRMFRLRDLDGYRLSISSPRGA